MGPRKNYSIYFVAACFGFASMTAQILLLRELMVAFYGNELSVGIMLACWLFWVAAGSWGQNWLIKYAEEKFKSRALALKALELCLVLASLILPFTIYLIRNIRNALGISSGEIVGLVPMAAGAFLALAPICLLFGFLFALSCRLVSRDPDAAPEGRARQDDKVAAIEVGRIYLMEAAGACAAGLAFTFLFVRVFNPVQTALLCGALNVCAALILMDGVRTKPLKWLGCLSAMLLIIYCLIYGAGPLDLRMRQAQWKKFRLVDIRDSVYGNIVLAGLGSQMNLFENGLLISSTEDPLTAEEAIHYCLLEHPEPKRIILIGGSLNGSLDEALKHPLEKIDYVELDPAIIDIGKENYPLELLKSLRHPKVTVNHLDGRLFIKRLSAEGAAKYDAVILMLPSPFTAQINRFYSAEFYREVKTILKEDGIFSFGVPSSENYISPQQAQFLGCLYRTLGEQFADVKVFPGDYNFFFACPKKGILTYDPQLLLRRLWERGLNLKYVREYYLPFKLDPQRIEQLRSAIDGARGARLNYDLRPIGYFYDMVLWSSRFASKLNERFEAIERLTAEKAALLLSLSFVILLLLQAKLRRPKELAVKLSIGTTGFSEMLFQVVVILSFQVIYGYVYYKVGLIFASFMLGLIAGSLVAMKLLARRAQPSKIYLATQASICVYPALLPPLFSLLKHPSVSGFTQSFAGEAFFSLLPVVAGFIGGLQFPLANRICAGREAPAGNVAGLLYGVDLLGACLGALLTSAILIPVLGINAACYLTSLMNAFVLLLLLLKPRYDLK